MKKITLFFTLLVLVTSCSVDDINDIDFTYELMPVTSIDFPDTINFNETYNFPLSYNRPSTCYGFAGFNVIENEQEVKLSILNTVIKNSSNCKNLENTTVTEVFEFFVKRNDYYTFKIYQGEDEEGNELYLTKEIMIQQ